MYFFMQKIHEEVKKESMKYILFYLDLNLLACNPEVILPPYYSHQEA